MLSLIIFFTSFFAATLFSQKVISTIALPDFKPNTLALYETGNKLFVDDCNSGKLLIYDCNTMELLAELNLEGGYEASSMAIYETGGKLFRDTWPGWENISVINAISNEFNGYIDVCAEWGPVIDQQLGKVIATSKKDIFLDYKYYKPLCLIDVNNFDIEYIKLSEAGIVSGCDVNPITHEIFISYLQGESLDIVNSSTKECITVPGINGRCVIINWLENKVYGEKGAFDGFWVYDRDIDSMKVCLTYNDANPAIFNPTSNRVHTGSEVNGETTIIEGSDDSWFNLPMYSATHKLGVRYSTNHVYYVGLNYIVILHGSSLERLVEIPNVWIDSPRAWDITINQSTGRVFVSYSDNKDGMVLVIQDTPDTVSTPIFNPYSGTYTEPQNVTINCNTPGATIYYTTDGFDPTESDSIYTNPVHISTTTILKAKAYKAEWNVSDVATGSYIITGTVSTPTFNPLPGTYTDPQNVTIICNTPGATIYYTTDGSDPTESDSIYTNPVHISTTTILKAKAYKAEWNVSDVATGSYIIQGTYVNNIMFETPGKFCLHQNYPNPFNPSTQINYSLSKSSQITLKIYNIQGQEIKTLIDEFQSAGVKSVLWDGLDNCGQKVTSGVYIYQINSGNLSLAKKMILVR